jgi:hypothetical protein
MTLDNFASVNMLALAEFIAHQQAETKIGVTV